MDMGPLVLIPPAVIFALALLTRNVLISLLVGVAAAGIIAANFSPLKGICLAITRLIQQTGIPEVIYSTGSYDKVFMFGFLVFLGILIEFMSHTGSLQIFTRKLLSRIKSARAAQMTSLVLSSCFFVDDYLNALMVGSIMRPITDAFKIPRTKLAYLIHAVSSPMAVIIPASSWVGMILTQLEASGVHKTISSASLVVTDPFRLYLCVIPFLFYPLLSIFSAWYIVYNKISFGLMYRYEEQARRDGNLFGGKAPLSPRSSLPPVHAGSTQDVILPLVAFVMVFAFTLLYTGHYRLLGGSLALAAAFTGGNSIFALFAASACATFISGLTILLKDHTAPSRLAILSLQGLKLMKNSLIILWLAWTLSRMLQIDLHTGDYVARLLSNSVDISLIPVIVFLATALTTASTGSSWGSIMLLMPLALPLIVNFLGHAPLTSLEALYQIAPVIGAILSGAIAGSHLSPITDDAVMASTSAQAYHLDHVQTQISYSLAPLIGTTIAFLSAGFFNHHGFWIKIAVSATLGLATCVGIIYIRNRQWANKQ